MHKPDYLFHSIHYACITNQQCNLNGKLLRKETAVVDADVIDYQTMTAFMTAFERLLWSLYTFPVSTTVACYWMILIEKKSPLKLPCEESWISHGIFDCIFATLLIVAGIYMCKYICIYDDNELHSYVCIYIYYIYIYRHSCVAHYHHNIEMKRLSCQWLSARLWVGVGVFF